MLERLILSTKNMPEITLDPIGMIKISGRSMGTNICDFSDRINCWIDDYIQSPADTTCINICFEYLNSSDIKFYCSIINKIKVVRLKNKKLQINWYYEEGDEDILEKGESVSLVLGLDFNFIKIRDSAGQINIEP